MKNTDKRLIGKWIIDSNDPQAIAQMGSVTIVFENENVMRYITLEKGSIRITCLTYWVDDHIIYSSLSPESKEEKTKFNFENETVLILESEGLKSRFLKVEE